MGKIQFLSLVLYGSASLQLHDKQRGFVPAGEAAYVKRRPPALLLVQHITGMASPCRAGSPGLPPVGSKRDGFERRSHHGDGGDSHLFQTTQAGIERIGHANRDCQPGKGTGPQLFLVSCCPHPSQPPWISCRSETAPSPAEMPLKDGRWLSCFPCACTPFQPGWLALLHSF